MSQPPPPRPPPPPSLPLTLTTSTAAAAVAAPVAAPAAAPNMTETQKLPIFSPPGFHDYSSRRLPPLEIPPDAVPPRSDHHFRSPINQLPSIHSGLPPRHDYHHHQPSSIHRSAAAPVEKLLQHSNPYTPPRSDPPYSPQQYGPSISPRSDFDSRGGVGPPRRLTEPRYPYDERRHYQHHQHPEQAYSSLTSPVEPSHQRPAYAPLPSPAYTPSYASSSTPFRTSVGSHQHAHSQRGSIGALPASIAYPDPPAAAPPARKQSRPIPLPGSIPQPVYNEQL